MESGYGPFYQNMIFTGWEVPMDDSEWVNTLVKTVGIPDEWEDHVVQQIHIDYPQFIYQNYFQGNFSQEFFNDHFNSVLQNSTDSAMFSKKPIKCFVHVAMSKTNDGSIEYILDTNNNLDFSDDEVRTPLPLNQEYWDDSLSQTTPVVEVETVIHNKITKISIPILVAEKQGMLLSNFPVHAKTKLDSNQIFIGSDYDPFFRHSSNLVVGHQQKKTAIVTGKNEILKIGSRYYLNQGVDYNKQALKLKKLPADTIVYSTQVGFPAYPFYGNELLTNDTIYLEKYRGKHLLIDFWGAWCKPCVEELPNLQEAYKNLDKSKIEFLSIAKDKRGTLINFLKENNIEWDQVLSNEDNNLTDLYNISRYPSSFLIDPEGVIVATDLRGERLLDTLDFYLN